MGLFAVLRALFRQTLPFPWIAAGVLGSVLYDTLFETAFPLMVAWIIDRAVLPGRPDEFFLPAALIAYGWLVSVGSQVGRDYLLAELVSRVTQRIRNRLAAHVEGLPFGRLRDLKAAEWQTLHGSDLTQVENLLLQVLPPFLFGVFYLLFGLGAMVATHPGLGGLVLVLLPITLVGPWLLHRRSSDQGARLREAEAQANAAAGELLAAQPVIRSFDLREAFRKDLVRRLETLSRWTAVFSFTSNLTRRLPNLSIHLVQLVLLLAGTWLAVTGHLALGELVAFNLLFANVLTAVLDLASTLGPLSRSGPAFSSLEPRLLAPGRGESPVQHPSVPEIGRSPDSGLAFEGVVFRYGTRQVLDEVSFVAPAGRRTAIVGASGSGKSTVTALVAGLYQPERGRILWGSTDLSASDLAVFRSRLAVVFQDNPVFDASLRDNVKLGAPGGDTDVWESLERAGLAAWVRGLPDGLDTAAGEGGGFLSGGQRQRLALARALYRKPELLVLDEATSALDPLTEGLVNDSLRLLAGATTIVHVSHRLPGIADYDHIVVLEGGRVVEAGTHDVLMDRPQGAYAALWNRQAGLVVTGGQARITTGGLRAIPLFSSSSPATLEALAASFVSETLEPGTRIIRQGTPGTRFFVVARGRVEVSLGGPDGEVGIASLSDGDFFGEMALLDATITSAHVTASQPTVVLALEKTTFLTLVANDPILGQAVAEVARHRREENARHQALGDPHHRTSR